MEDLTRTLKISTESVGIPQEDITALSQRKRTQIQDEENDVKKNQGTLFTYYKNRLGIGTACEGG